MVPQGRQGILHIVLEKRTSSSLYIDCYISCKGHCPWKVNGKDTDEPNGVVWRKTSGSYITPSIYYWTLPRWRSWNSRELEHAHWSHNNTGLLLTVEKVRHENLFPLNFHFSMTIEVYIPQKVATKIKYYNINPAFTIGIKLQLIN